MASMSGTHFYAVRRQDGEQMGGYGFTFLVVDDPNDWTPAEEAEDEYGTVYEMVKMTVEVVGTRTLPVCKECDEPAEFWGLCEKHAREDDPEHFEKPAAEQTVVGLMSALERSLADAKTQRGKG